MNKKLFLPLLAIVFAIACAFAAKPLPQQSAFYKPAVGPVTSAPITVPTNTDNNPCLITNTEHLCMVGSRIAYRTEAGAGTADEEEQLKWND